jgi:hypothetical protein
MARGWESKSVEAQQAEAIDESTKTPAQRLTPEQATLHRQVEGLRLSRQRVLHQLEATIDARHRKLLEEALASLDEELRKLN